MVPRIKDTIRANVFLNETARNGFKIVNKNYSDAGVTIFQFESSRKTLKIKPKSASAKIKYEINVTTKICIKCKEPLNLLKESNWYQCPQCGKLLK